jgi:steroid delta-isomerase-like uncharacterized protein
MSEENKALVRRFYDEVMSRGNLAAVGELSAPNLIDHNPMPGQAPGPEGIKQVVAMFRAALPDLNVTVDDIIAEGDKVVARTTIRGTHRGEFMGIAPTNKQVTVNSMDLVRIVNGKAAEVWHIEDALGMMQQIGAIPS